MRKISSRVVLRYWGSHFKSQRHVRLFEAESCALLAQGWEYHLVLERAPDDPSWLEKLNKTGVGILYLPRPRGTRDLVAMFRLYRLCRRTRPTVMQCDNIHVPALVAAALAHVPVRLWTKRSMSAHFEQCRGPTFKEKIAFTTRLSCYLSTRVIAVSKAIKRELVGLGIREQKITVRPNPRKLGPQLVLSERNMLRAALGFAKQHVVIATIGHAVPVKGWDLLLLAFAEVAKSNPHARIVMGGSYTAKSERDFFTKLQQMIRQSGLDGKVRFVGHVSDVRRVLGAADLFVLPSRSEGCANALIEALEAGLACVATRVGNAEEVVEHGINGYLVDRCDVKGMAKALVTLTQDNDLRAAFATKAKPPDGVPALEEYSETIARDYEALLPDTAHD